MYVSRHLLGRATSLGLFQWAYDFRQGKKTVKTKKYVPEKWKKNLFVTFKKPEKPLLLWYAQILCKLVFAMCVSSYSKRLHGFCVVSRVKCIGWACGVSVSSGQWLFWCCTAAGTGPGPEPLGDWVPLGGDWREEGEVAHPGFLKLFAETFKRHWLNLPAVQCSCVR